MPERPSMWCIFEKRIDQGSQIAEIQKYKNTDTKIHKYTNTVNDKVQERPNMWYIFKKRINQGYQN